MVPSNLVLGDSLKRKENLLSKKPKEGYLVNKPNGVLEASMFSWV